jgi:hypothetical protein
VRAGVLGAAAFALSFLVPAAPGHAQSLPPAAAPPPLPGPGFMPPYEVTKVVRSAGLEPLAPPLREGTTYVLRATDFRGILMRVVVDAHSGAIRAVNRIVPGPGPYGPGPYGPGPYGPIGMATPPYGNMPLPYGMPPPYGIPPAYGPPSQGAGMTPDMMPEMMPDEAALAPPLAPPLPPSMMRPAPHPSVAGPPLPRPRPAELASRDVKGNAKPDEPPPVKPDAKPSATVTAPPAAPAPAPAAAPKKPPPPPINE